MNRRRLKHGVITAGPCLKRLYHSVNCCYFLYCKSTVSLQRTFVLRW